MEPDRRETFSGRTLRGVSLKTGNKRNLLHTIEKRNQSNDEHNQTKDSLTIAIEEVDAQIEALGIRPAVDDAKKQKVNEMCKRLYPTLTNVEKDDYISPTSLNSEKDTIITTPKLNRRSYKPNMESTRKSLTPLTQLSGNRTDSIQVDSLISTIHPNPDSPAGIENSIPDEVERFLEDALGDHMNNSNITFGPSDTRDISNAIELHSHERTPFYRRLTQKFLRRRKATSPQNDSFISSVKNTGTLDRSRRLCRSLSQKIKKGLRGIHTQAPSTGTSPEVIEQNVFSNSKCEQVDEILQKIKVEQSMINQARKALSFCRSNEEFMGSSEEVESERVLLLASIRRRLLTEELKRISGSSAEVKPTSAIDTKREYGEVSIYDISLQLRNTLRMNPMPGEVSDWFVVVIMQGLNVWATPAASCYVDSFMVIFPDFICTISQLPPDLKITIEIYNLKLKTGITLNHEVKYHIHHPELDSSSICPSPTKLLKKSERPLSPRSPKGIENSSSSSSFVLSGYVELTVHDLTLCPPWPLTAVPNDSILFGTINLGMACKLHLSVSNQGFLTQCDEAGGIPNRAVRWCVLKGHTLMLWKYREDQEDKPALITIDLTNCISKRIGIATGSLCARPRTMLIETARPREAMDTDTMLVQCRQNRTIVRHLLSCNTKKELDQWISKLNHVISTLREWNVLVAYYPAPIEPLMVSDL